MPILRICEEAHRPHQEIALRDEIGVEDRDEVGIGFRQRRD